MFAVLRQRRFALLWIGGLLSLMGDTMLYVALPFHVYSVTGSTVATSTLVLANTVPGLLFGSVAGVFVDRWDRRRTMVLANMLLAVGLIPLLLVRSADWIWVIYVVAFVEATIAQFFRPAESALLPQLVGEEHLVPANALNALNNNVAWLLGPPLGGIVVGLVGLKGVALLDSASFLVAGLLIACIRYSARAQAPPAPARPASASHPWLAVWREWVAGLRVVRHEPRVRGVFVVRAISMLGEGVFGALFVPLVTSVLAGGAADVGWMLGAQAVGGLVGSLVIGIVGDRIVPARLLGMSAICFGLLGLAIYNVRLVAPGMTIVLVLTALVGVPGMGFMTALQTLLQTSVADTYRGRVFGAYGTTAALFGLVGTTMAGAFGDRLGVVTVLNIQGSMYILVGLLVLSRLRAFTMQQGSQRARRAATPK